MPFSSITIHTFVPAVCASLVWGSPQWLWPTVIAAALSALVVVAWSVRDRRTGQARLVATILKLVAIVALALCIVEPLFSGSRPRPGANLFAVVADNSQSLTIADRAGQPHRGEELRKQLQDDAPWLARLGQDFDLRKYLLDGRLRSTDSFRPLTFDGQASSLRAALTTIAGQFRDRPLAGVLIFTDGNATDWNEAAIDFGTLPPIYPVVVGADRVPRDVQIGRVSVTQTNFETTPVTVQADVVGETLGGEEVVVQLVGPDGKEVQRHATKMPTSGSLSHRFLFRPDQPGVSFFQVRAFAAADEAAVQTGKATSEATQANNARLALVDRGHGPYRVLYVAGRPNWDFKFIRRAMREDEEVQLIGLLRIAKREAKFTFRGRDGESTNPLFRGFGNQADDTAEQYDEPVLVRFGSRDPSELRDGFPKTAEQLFEYHAIVLDDVEAKFFTRDQMSLLQQFVSLRGGALLMLGGEESFGLGEYARTPIGDLLPVYVEKTRPAVPPGEYKLALSREGWLQPWVRLRATEPEEEKRLAEMPTFRVVNAAANIKPGATVLGRVAVTDGSTVTSFPALVAQPFGEGRAAALLIGDLWRWGLRRPAGTESDLEKAWRQTVRWLVADVPGRVTARVTRETRDMQLLQRLSIQVRDATAQPLDNATVTLRVKTPDGKDIEVDVDVSEKRSGVYEAVFAPRAAGGYHAAVTAVGPDGSDIGSCDVGFIHEPAIDELRSLRPNRQLLKTLAERTKGEVIELNRLDAFVASLPNRRVPITEPWVYPLWHQWPMLFVALACLIGEWGVRRWRGMP